MQQSGGLLLATARRSETFIFCFSRKCNESHTLYIDNPKALCYNIKNRRWDRMQKAIFFDLDGTLTDSGEGIINCAT